MSEVDDRIDRWVAAGLIDAVTASRLRVFEADQRPSGTLANSPATPPAAPPGAPPVPTPVPPPRTGSLALIGEVVGYLGAVLAVSAISFMVSQTWAELPTPGKLLLVGALLAVVAVAGVMAARVPKAPAQRLASVLLLAAVALSGWFAWVVAHDAVPQGDSAIALWVTGVMVAIAAVVYARRRRALAQIALLATLIALVMTIVGSLHLRSEFAWGGIALAVLGAVWVALAVARLLEPDRVGLVVGGLATLVGLQSATFDDARGWILTLGLLVSVAMLATSVVRRGESALIVPGAIGLLVMVPQLINHLFSDSLATWLAVLVTGVALVGVAVWMVRDRARTTPAADAGVPASHSA